MASVNKVILIGNLGADPEMRSLPSGSKVANFSIATSESWTNKNGEKVEQTEWHRIELWDSLAGIAEQYLKKGDPVYIEGRIRTEKWTDQSGQERYTTKIRGNALQLLGSRGGGGGSYSENSESASSSSSYSSASSSSKPVSVPAPPPVEMAGGDDDLPF